MPLFKKSHPQRILKTNNERNEGTSFCRLSWTLTNNVSVMVGSNSTGKGRSPFISSIVYFCNVCGFKTNKKTFIFFQSTGSQLCLRFFFFFSNVVSTFSLQFWGKEGEGVGETASRMFQRKVASQTGGNEWCLAFLSSSCKLKSTHKRVNPN